MSATTRSSSPATVLLLPGLNGSGSSHWQSIWAHRHPDWRFVDQESWSEPRLGDWAAALEHAVRAEPGPVVLVAHSLACALVAHWARAGRVDRVAAALLVAPADVDRLPNLPVHGFTPMPLERLPFAAWVVASQDDPCCTMQRAHAFARAWGARLLDVGRSGHLNVQSGHGSWPQGEALLTEIVRLARRATIAPGSLAHGAIPRLAPLAQQASGGAP